MQIRYVVMGFLLFLLLGLRFFFYYTSLPVFQNGQTVHLIGMVQNQPKLQGDSQKLTLISQGNTFFITTKQDPQYWYAEKLTVQGTIRAYTHGQQRLLSLSYPAISINTQQNPLAKFSEYIREKVSETYTFSLDNDMKGLLIGMVFGIQQNMSTRFLQALQTSGVMHVIAASGMNITFIAGLLLGISQTFSHRRFALAFTLLGIIFYTALAGFQPSIVRAAIMGGLTLVAGLTGRQSYSLLGLFAAAIGMLFFNPGWLFDIGFQLSFTATAGLFFVKPLIDRGLSRVVKKDNILLADLSTTTAAQISTLPILMANFGYYNPFSIVINLLVLWTVPFVMLIGSLAAILTFIFLPLAQVTVYVVYPLLWYFKTVVLWGSTIPSVWQVNEFPLTLTLGYYCVIVGLILMLRKRGNNWKNQESRIKNQESRIKNQESRIKNQESRIKNQESRIKNQELRIKN